MISVNDLRKGIFFEMNGQTYEVMEVQHVKNARSSAYVRSKIRSLDNGSITDHTFNPNDKYPRVLVENKDMTYLYNDGQFYYFMDPVTFDQIPMTKDSVEDALKWVMENDKVNLRFVQGEPHDVEAPNFVELKVSDTDPGLRGDTTSGGSKPATVETGMTINVPLFVNIGDTLKIDTRTGEYISRV